LFNKTQSESQRTVSRVTQNVLPTTTTQQLTPQQSDWLLMGSQRET